jgi:hypothetical protein
MKRIFILSIVYAILITANAKFTFSKENGITQGTINYVSPMYRYGGSFNFTNFMDGEGGSGGGVTDGKLN